VQDEQTGEQVILNDTSRVRAKIVLDDIPSTPTFRLQQMQMLHETAKSLPEEQQAVLVPFLVEMSDMPNKGEVVDQLREMMGLGDEEAKAQAQQAQQAQAEALAKMQQRVQVLEAALTAAKVRKENAAADKLQAETAQIGIQPAEYTEYATSEHQ